MTDAPFEGIGAWNSMNTSNSYESTSLAFGSQNVQVRNISTYDEKSIVAVANGEIPFSIGKNSGSHTASFNYASVTAVPGACNRHAEPARAGRSGVRHRHR